MVPHPKQNTIFVPDFAKKNVQNVNKGIVLPLSVRQVADLLGESKYVIQNWVRSLRPFIPIRKNESGYNELWDDAVQILYLVHTLHREKGYSIKQIEKYFTMHKDEFMSLRDEEQSPKANTDSVKSEWQNEGTETESIPLPEVNNQAEPPAENEQEAAASRQQEGLVAAIIELTKSINTLTIEVGKLSAREKECGINQVTEASSQFMPRHLTRKGTYKSSKVIHFFNLLVFGNFKPAR